MKSDKNIPFFSIIVPVYNCEKYLKTCIESVMAQTYPSWELILVDDGSTDTSGNICDEFAPDPRIKVIHQENAGELNSRWKGITAASGCYELGLDADDYLDVNCLEVIKRAVDDSGSELIFFGIRCVGALTNIIKCSLKPKEEYSGREIIKTVIKETNTSLCNKAIKLDKVKKARVDLKSDVRFNLDYALIIPILCNINTGYIIDDVLYNYRIHDASISHLCKAEHVFDTGDVTEYVIRSLEDASLMEPDIYQQINLTYLDNISYKLLELFANDKISKADCRRIHKSNVYVNSRRAESSKELELFKYLILKLFRCKQYWLLRMMAKAHKARNGS